MMSSFLPHCQLKFFQDFCPGSLLEGRAEFFQVFGWNFGRNKFNLNLTDLQIQLHAIFYLFYLFRIRIGKSGTYVTMLWSVSQRQRQNFWMNLVSLRISFSFLLKYIRAIKNQKFKINLPIKSFQMTFYTFFHLATKVSCG